MFSKFLWLPLVMIFMASAGLKASEALIPESGAALPWLGQIADKETDRDIAVNLRGGDGTNYLILSVLSEGRYVLVHEVRGDWLRVEPVESSIPAWVSKDFFTVGTLGDQTAVCNADRVVIREGATAHCAALGYLTNGQKVQVIKSVNNWLQIEAPVGTTAWIFARYVKEVANGSSLLAQLRKSSSVTTEKTRELIEEQAVPTEKVYTTAENESAVDHSKETQESDTDLDRIRREFEARLQELQFKRAQNLEAIDAMAGLNPYTASGRIMPPQGSEAGYILELGGRRTFFLRSAVDKDRNPLVDFIPYQGIHVGVMGRIVDENGHRWIEVKRIEILKSPE